MKKQANHKPTREEGEFYLEVDGEKISVSESVYRAVKRPAWTEHKRKEREKRCRIDGHRCTQKCSECDRQKDGAPLSLEKFRESGYKPGESESTEDIVLQLLLLEKLAEELRRLAPTDELILRLFGDGKSEREISQILKERAQTNSSIQGLSQKSVNLHKTSLFALLREKLKDYR